MRRDRTPGYSTDGIPRSQRRSLPPRFGALRACGSSPHEPHEPCLSHWSPSAGNDPWWLQHAHSNTRPQGKYPTAGPAHAHPTHRKPCSHNARGGCPQSRRRMHLSTRAGRVSAACGSSPHEPRLSHWSPSAGEKTPGCSTHTAVPGHKANIRQTDPHTQTARHDQRTAGRARTISSQIVLSNAPA